MDISNKHRFSSGQGILPMMLFASVVWGMAGNVWSDDGKQPHELPSSALAATAAKLSAVDFDVWMKNRIRYYDTERQNPRGEKGKLLTEVKFLEEVLAVRLRDEKYSSDYSVKAVVYAWADWDRLTSESPTARTYDQAKRIIVAILPLLYDRDRLKADLHWCLAGYWEGEKDYRHAVDEYQAAAELFKSQHIAVDLCRVAVQLNLATNYIVLKQADKAEAALLQVLSYDWVKVREPEAQDRLKRMYIQAGHALIDLRRFKLKDLRNTFFIPSTVGILGPHLQAAIKEAGGSQKDVDAVLAGYVF